MPCWHAIVLHDCSDTADATFTQKVILVTNFWDLILQEKLLTHAHLDSMLNNLCILDHWFATKYWPYLKASPLFFHSSLTHKELILIIINYLLKTNMKNFFQAWVNIGQVLLESVLAIWRLGPNTSMLNWHISENQLK